MKTDRFELTVGFVAGYGHGVDSIGDSFEKSVARHWQQLMKDDVTSQPTDSDGSFLADPIYVPAVVSASRAVYLADWGCPDGGEPTVTITGQRNPEFNRESTAWRAAVLRIAERLRVQSGQNTAQIVFTECDFVYLK